MIYYIKPSAVSVSPSLLTSCLPSGFQEAITHLQEMEEDLVDTHHNVIQTMQNWVQEDTNLISMTQEVDYDQDGN